MRVAIRLFAVCRDRAGQDRVELDLPGDTATVKVLLSVLGTSVPSLAPLLSIVRVAVNEEFAGPEDPVTSGDRIALIPPVSGGSGVGPFEIRETPLDPREVEDAVRHAGAGAVASFLGTVRDHTGPHRVVALEYEAYDEMAERFLRRIGQEVSERWPGARVAILHRKGRLEPGEISVAISVASPHRAAAFEACRHAIERLKQDVPIWKKEVREDGSVWVGVGS